MTGAREYADVIDRRVTRYKKLYIAAGEHARGKTLQIWILDSEDAKVESIWTYQSAVMVYGVIRGNPGWTEECGWLHRGPWEADFNNFVSERRELNRVAQGYIENQKADKLSKAAERTQMLLSRY